MKKIISNNIVLAALFLFSYTVNAAPEIQTWKTKQGTPVYFVQASQLPMVDIEIAFHLQCTFYLNHD